MFDIHCLCIIIILRVSSFHEHFFFRFFGRKVCLKDLPELASDEEKPEKNEVPVEKKTKTEGGKKEDKNKKLKF